MDKIIYSVRLDVQSIGVQAILHGFSVGDVNCRQICVSLSQRGKTIMLDGTETALMYVKKDGAKNPTVNPCTIKGSTIVYEVTQDDCSVEGQTEFTVKVQKDGVILYAPSFVGIVKNPGVNGASNPSGPEYTLIETLIDDIQSLNRRVTYIEENGVSGGGGGVNFETGDGLVLEDDVLKVDDSVARISDLDYEKLENIPTVEGIEVKGNKTLADFSLRKMVEIEYDDYMLLDEYEPNTVYLVKNDPSDGSVEITDEQIASAIENYLNEHPISGTVTPEDIAAAVEDYLTENPIGGVTDEQIASAVDAYLTEHPISGVTTEDVTNAVNAYLTEHPDQFKGPKGDDGESATPEQIAQAVEGYISAHADEFKGEKGDDGHTPVKGTDYFTQTDKNEIVNAVIAALPEAESEEF